jgi:hypothetical protein
VKVVLRSIEHVQPYERNARLNDDAVSAVAASIREFGLRQPIVVDGDGVIICGHTRYKAAQTLGLDKVPVHVAKDLTPDQIKAYRIAQNQTASLAEWDFDLLPRRRKRAGPVWRQRIDVDGLQADPATCVPDGTRPVLRGRHRPALGKVLWGQGVDGASSAIPTIMRGFMICFQHHRAAHVVV